MKRYLQIYDVTNFSHLALIRNTFLSVLILWTAVFRQNAVISLGIMCFFPRLKHSGMLSIVHAEFFFLCLFHHSLNLFQLFVLFLRKCHQNFPQDSQYSSRYPRALDWHSEINYVLQFDLLYVEQRIIPVAITFSGTWCQVSQLSMANPGCMPFVQHSYSPGPQGFPHLCKIQWDSLCFSYSLSVSSVTAVTFAWKCFVPSKQLTDWVLSPPCVFQHLRTSSYGA